jgi:DNA-binding transcriptional LysR family regulator
LRWFAPSQITQKRHCRHKYCFIAQTEQMAAFALFERVRGRLVPTAKAQELYAETERLFAGVEQVTALCQRLRDEAPRPIVLASVPTLTFSLIPAMAQRWRAEERTESFTIHSRIVGNVLGPVTSRRADLGLVIGVPRSLPGLHNVLPARQSVVYARPARRDLHCAFA